MAAELEGLGFVDNAYTIFARIFDDVDDFIGFVKSMITNCPRLHLPTPEMLKCYRKQSLMQPRDLRKKKIHDFSLKAREILSVESFAKLAVQL
ncbi:hypothetical protein L0337_15255 [candidate division KSB1 bacterium]|nr:hypothetical protein [candidate division KSB1 bacterium]